MYDLTPADRRFLQIVEEGTEQDFYVFKTDKLGEHSFTLKLLGTNLALDMPPDLAKHPWFRKNNAYHWLFVRDAYCEHLIEELLRKNNECVLLVLSKLTCFTHVVFRAQDDLDGENVAASSSAPTSTKRKRAGHAKSRSARRRISVINPNTEIEVIEVSSSESDASTEPPTRRLRSMANSKGKEKSVLPKKQATMGHSIRARTAE